MAFFNGSKPDFSYIYVIQNLLIIGQDNISVDFGERIKR
jgi:hypothetical protein